jgi:hypothetical protein
MILISPLVMNRREAWRHTGLFCAIAENGETLMAGLHSLGRVAPRLPDLIAVRAIMGVAGILFLSFSFTHAAPVRFRFEAEVASAFPSEGGANLPFTIVPGDLITGIVTFEPGSRGPTFSQSGGMTFEIHGIALETADYQITVAHNSEIGIDVPGRIADPNNTPDVDGAPIGDNINLSCLTDGALYCGSVVGHSNIRSRPNIVFSEPALVLNSNDLISDLAIWRSFSRREMSLLFRDINTGSTTYVGAYVSSIEEIPEPSTLGLLGLYCLMAVNVVIHANNPRALVSDGGNRVEDHGSSFTPGGSDYVGAVDYVVTDA